jgi:L-tyrosine isonitrile synthase
MRTFTYAPFIDKTSAETAKKILAELKDYRRTPSHSDSCTDIGCESCSSFHLTKIFVAVAKHAPVTFVLPAFPGKSPNTEKVLGVLPDQAERLSLEFLGQLCKSVKKYYAPGIKIILCSDGRVFSDVVGMVEKDVTAYQREIDRLIKELDLTDISTFSLDDIFGSSSFDEMRTQLMDTFGTSLNDLKEKVRRGAAPSADHEDIEANRMYCGITRFLVEDSTHAKQEKSRTAVQKEARTRAYEVIRRSNAWSELLAKQFPEAVRLSIHPHACGSKKLGIQLIGNETWMTPWHGVAVKTPKGYVLLKRAEAESLGAELIYSDGRPSHFEMAL